VKLVALLVLSSVCAAQAQTASYTLTAKNGEPIGTVTVDGNRAYLRDLEEKLIGTVVALPDGTRTAYDADGNVVKKMVPGEDQDSAVRR